MIHDLIRQAYYSLDHPEGKTFCSESTLSTRESNCRKTSWAHFGGLYHVLTKKGLEV